MNVEVSFPGGKRVDARVGGHVISTDQPADKGGQDAAPAPYDLFLASVATCAGIYALGFCQARSLPTEGLGIGVSVEADEHGIATGFDVELRLPDGFPEKYRAAIVKSVEGCKVKKTLAASPSFTVKVA